MKPFFESLCTNHHTSPATWTDSVICGPGLGGGNPEYKRIPLCEDCAQRHRRDRGNTARLKRICQNDPNDAEFQFQNGDEISFFCSVCLSETLLDLVTSNEEVSFRYERWANIHQERGINALVTVT